MICHCGHHYIHSVCYNCGHVYGDAPLGGLIINPFNSKVSPGKKYKQPSEKKGDKIFSRDGHRCLKCGFRPGDLPKGNNSNHLTIDHIIPQSLGGNNTENNLQTLCLRCNREKGNKNSIDYRV